MGLDDIFNVLGVSTAVYICVITIFVSALVYTVLFIVQRYAEKNVSQSRRNIFILNFHCLLELAHHKVVYMSDLGLKVLMFQHPQCFTEVIYQTGTQVSRYKHYLYWSKNRCREESVAIILDPKMKGMIYDVHAIEYTIENVNDLYLLNIEEG